MSSLALARTFLDAFSAADLPKLRALLADDLVFRGPFARFDSADEYAAAIAADPPAGV
ncbi:MAG: nuclear transport factor 2 family protein, partial [Gemmatimonadetes bacterium]|nr:nuclear transport factor 2 family protein [Gemmatimonadota bacterium]